MRILDRDLKANKAKKKGESAQFGKKGFRV